jgi:EAL domain-containing protein (putative c-di-GMP-specific phosphodiesterase class I)
VAVDLLDKLRRGGVKIAIDDFGTGCFSLSKPVEDLLTWLEAEAEAKHL